MPLQIQNLLFQRILYLQPDQIAASTDLDYPANGFISPTPGQTLFGLGAQTPTKGFGFDNAGLFALDGNSTGFYACDGNKLGISKILKSDYPLILFTRGQKPKDCQAVHLYPVF